MKIGIIGAGRIGGTLARGLAAQGHEITVSNRRGADAMTDLLADLGKNGRAGSDDEAAWYGDIVMVATPLNAWRDLPPDSLAGKIVVDANNYSPERDGPIPELDSGELGSSELLAKKLPRAKVVKAFNTIFWERLRDGGRPAGDPERLAIPVSSDDADAKAVVSGLIDGLGFDPVDNGRLADGRNQQPGTAMFNAAVSADEARGLLGD